MVFEGDRFGAEGDCIGELVFTTGMTGYIETLTDPSYYGQIIMFTFPLVGNYGIMEEDFEGSGTAARGCVLRQWCDTPSNFRCEYDLDTYLKKKGIPGICGIDTRRITRIIREYGVMNAVICDEVPENLDRINSFAITEAVKNVSTGERTFAPAAGQVRRKVTLIDYGTKYNIVRELQNRGCDVTVVPYDTTAEDILAGNPDGIMLSNGPGDPSENVFAVEQLKKLLGRAPLFGICLGHQLLALANGGRTVKLKYGHRGANQPVEDL
ncbi:MAG: glutamine-hydrolyzing carbamoyl-phosphate synthase small subunit, partial [Oscillospiraceae bacterium]|nr:glutamine-hydrolyzing carbamoyl-phosphate synthase small subunit [Oscillospiraceae bacterium]